MYLFSFKIILSLAVGVLGNGELIFLSKPPSIDFQGHEQCDPTIVKDIISTSLGFTTDGVSEFPGVYINSPFNFAESVVVMAVHGVPSIGINDGHKFSFEADGPLDDMRETLESKMFDRYPYGENQCIVNIDLENDVKTAELNLNKGSLHLKKQNVKSLTNEDSNFVTQMALLDAIVDKIEEKGVPVDGLPDLYWFNLRGLHPIVDIYGENSEVTKEAKDMVTSKIEHMKNVLDGLYQNKTLFLVLTSDSAHTRRFRRAASEIASDRNLATVYDENYPVFFNIFLWFTIAFIMAIIATSMVTACMDPGRDSIIYRMTSTRMKKDN